MHNPLHNHYTNHYTNIGCIKLTAKRDRNATKEHCRFIRCPGPVKVQGDMGLAMQFQNWFARA